MAKSTSTGSYLVAARITADCYSVWRKLTGKNDGDKLRNLLLELSNYSETPKSCRGTEPTKAPKQQRDA